MQEVIFVKNFDKQNQTKVDQAADTNWAIKKLAIVLTVLEAYCKSCFAETFTEYYLLIFSGLLQNLSELSN